MRTPQKHSFKILQQILYESMTFPPTLMNKVAWIEAGLMTVFMNLKLDERMSLTKSWIDEKILVYVAKMWHTLHNNDINQNPGSNI